MKTEELQDAVHTKNDIIQRQTRRILMLEEKFSQLRQKYFELKYGTDKPRRAGFELHR